MSALKHPQRVLAEVELVSSHFGPIEFDEQFVLVKKFDLPPGFNKRKSKLLVILPANYPEAPPKDLYLNKKLKKNGSKPEHYFENKYGEKIIRKAGYAWYSIHFKSWNPCFRSIVRGDNLLTAINALYDALKYDD